MDCIKIDLSRTLIDLEIHVFADLHTGDKHCDMKLVKERIKHVKEIKNAYCILNGDICNWAIKTGKSDVYAEELTPMEQIQNFVDLFDGIKNKIICVTTGNHEGRSYKTDGIDITALACKQMGIYDKYSNTSALLFIRFGCQTRGTRDIKGQVRRTCYVIYALHGGGGGRKEGSKANRLADMASIVDADIYIHSHTHLPMIMKQSFFRVDMQNSTSAPVDKLFVNTGAALSYGGYAEINEYKPATKATPVIKLCGKQKKSTATL